MTPRAPTVTIGLPFYNAAAYLDNAIQSVVNQTFSDWEMILLDDGSTDGSAAVARRWASDPRIRLILDGQNEGLPARLNQIARLARGRYLARMDADDVMAPHRLATQVDFLESSPETHLVASFAYVIDTRNRVYGFRGRVKLPETLREAIRATAIIHPTVMARREWFLQHPYDPAWRRSQDQELWLRTLFTSQFAVIPQPLLFYRERGLPYAAKYRRTAAELQRLVVRYRPRLSGPTVAYYWLLFSLKSFLYTLLSRLKLESWLLHRRNRTLSPEERREAETLLRRGLKRGDTGPTKPAPAVVVTQLFSVPESLLFLEGQIPYFREQGFEVEVMCAPGQAAREFAARTQCRLTPVPFRRTLSPLLDLRCLFRVYRHFQESRPRIVHANTPKAGLLGMLAARLAGVPVRVYELHGLPLESQRGPMRRVLWLTEWVSCRVATVVLAVSPSLKKQALHYRLVTPQKIQVLENGSCNGVEAVTRFNPERIDPADVAELRRNLRLSGRVIGFIGRLTRDKGLSELVEAWAVLRSRYPDLTLLLIGAPELGSLKKAPQITAWLADSRVRCLGFVPDIERYYALLDVLVLPTYREGLPQVLLEAAAMRVPVVASRVTGAVDAVVEQQTGLFCEPFSSGSLVRMVGRYLEDPELARKHGEAARQRVLDRYSPPAIWAAKYRLYCQLLDAKGSPSQPIEPVTA
ncbi:glycosyltransferase [Tellurirhabdus rosea]|uniref:glycosyltransferase n=1 Tax=Tellurirhabdus rosea TaxID=2674997 RepID=UPI002256715D|nr:glycosyltransferase [Tellurirhabdus rosea]